MFSEHRLNGRHLPPGTLSLTFDDGPGVTEGAGPGPKTLQIAEFLHAQGISATFFMLGRHIIQHPEIPAKVAELGHLIGNHAFCHHRDFVELLAEGFDILPEIELTDELIRPFNPKNTIYFRPPWGRYSPEIARYLNAELHNGLNHVGPVGWDVDTTDWYFWQQHGSAEGCAESIWQSVSCAGSGIILMHDSSADSLDARRHNLSFEMLQILIPRLLEEEFQFVNLDEVPM